MHTNRHVVHLMVCRSAADLVVLSQSIRRAPCPHLPIRVRTTHIHDIVVEQGPINCFQIVTVKMCCVVHVIVGVGYLHVYMYVRVRTHLELITVRYTRQDVRPAWHKRGDVERATGQPQPMVDAANRHYAFFFGRREYGAHLQVQCACGCDRPRTHEPRRSLRASISCRVAQFESL
jgi:hypothetical protein